MASIKPGTYTFGEIFDHAGFNFAKEAAAEYNNGGPDYRRVLVGGLGLDDLSDKLVVPPTADQLVIALDGNDHTILDVDTSDEEHARERALALSVSALTAESESK